MFKKNASLASTSTEASTSTDIASSSSQPFVDETIKNLCETFMAVLEEAAKVGAVTPAVLTELADARSKGYDAWSEKLAEKLEIVEHILYQNDLHLFFTPTDELAQRQIPKSSACLLAEDYFNFVVAINENEEHYNALLLNPLFKQSLDVGLSNCEEDYKNHPNYYLAKINKLHKSVDPELSTDDILGLIKKASRVKGLPSFEKLELLRKCAELYSDISKGSHRPSLPNIIPTLREISTGIIENEEELNLLNSSCSLMSIYTNMTEPEDPPSLVMLMLGVLTEHTQLLEKRTPNTLLTSKLPTSFIGLVHHITSYFPSADCWRSSPPNMKMGL